MKVLQLSKFYAPERGGIESTVRELAGGLSRAGWSTDVLCAHRKLLSRRHASEEGGQVFRAGSFGTLLSTSISPALLFQVRRLAGQYDLIHVHMPNPMAALALWMARPKCRLLVHWHSDVVRQQRAMKLYASLQQWLLGRADAIVTTSQAYAESSAALAHCGTKVKVVPLGIADRSPAVDPAQVAALRERHGGRDIVFALGRMVAYKGFDVLIQACEDLPDTCVVVIGGDGPLLPAHRAQVAARGLQARIVLPGALSDAEVLHYHHAASLFCMPSVTRAEAFGVSLLEAMSAGRPLVTSRIPGSALDWVNQDGVTGLTCPAGSAPALAEALRSLLEDPALQRRLGEASRQRYLQHFTSQAMVERFTTLYEELLAA